MENAPPRTLHLPRPVTDGVELKTTSYEKASIGLTSILMLFGVITFLMFLIWLSSQWKWERAVATVGLEDVGGGGKGDNLTEDRDMEIPGMEEMPAPAEHQVEQ